MLPAMPQQTHVDVEGERCGEVLRSLRERTGLTQQELAEQAGLTPHAISALERGTRTRPYPHTVRALAQALGATEEERATLISSVPRGRSQRRPRPAAGPPAAAAAADAPAAAASVDLVVPPTRLLGREAEVGEVVELLRSGARLVTLTGPGGVGKTRLAAAVAERAGSRHPDGVFRVSLASVADAALVAPVLARVLGLPGTDGPDAFTAVAAHLAPLRALLVLDNFEHLLSAAPRIAELTALASGVSVLVTSRSPLQVRGEREYAVAPLALPPVGTSAMAELEGSPAGALVLDRLESLTGSRVLPPDDVRACAEICHRLAGLPLALELATAHLRVLEPTALLGRLEQTLSTGGSRDLPERQRTMRATLDWSFGLLDERAQQLFTLLATFRVGATLESAERLAVEAGGFAREEVLPLLGVLVESSLVVVRRADDGRQRFVMLEPVAQYARSLLLGDRAAAAARAHARLFLDLADEAAVGYEHGDQVDWLARIEVEEADIVVAVERSLDLGTPEDIATAASLTWSMWLYWWLRGHLVLGRRLAEACLAHDLTDHARSRALLAAATMSYAGGDLAAATDYWDRADRLAGELDDDEVYAKARAGTGLAALGTGEFGAAESRFREALDRADGAGSTWMASLVHVWLGTVLLLRGKPQHALAPIEQGLELARGRGDRLATYVALYNLAQVALALHDDALARRHVLEGIALSEETGDLANLAWFTETLAAIEARAGDHPRAATLLGASDGLREVVGADVYAYYLPDAQLRVDAEAAARSALGEDAYGDALDAGRALEAAEVITLALG
jgi:predicted ATPase/transcriptional regulator with XRE-family HTH domain